MRHILRFILFAILLALATSAKAQDCSTAVQPLKTWTEQPSNWLCGTGSGQTYSGDPTFTVYSTTVDTCTNQNNGWVYAQSVRQVTGIGAYHCFGGSTSLNTKCNPIIQQELTPATSPTDYNRFYLRAWDVNPSNYNSCANVINMSRQDFWECIGIKCCQTDCPYPLNGCIPCGQSPIILDLNGQGFELTSAANGVTFDISGGGHPVRMGWIARGADNGFLALPGPDGVVHNGQQLFGNFTPQPPGPAPNGPNGFAALSVYDDPKNGGNGDGIIDSRDLVFASLRVWIDANHDGICQPEELHTLPSVGVEAISLKYELSKKTDEFGNVFRYVGKVNPGDPTNVGRKIYDVFFVGDSPSAKNGSKCAAPPAVKGGMLSADKTTKSSIL